MEEIDWSSLHKILSDTTRRNILELLAEKQELSYTEIMAILRITNTGRLNYHLKALSALVSKDDQGKYSLTEKGKIAANMLKTFPAAVPAERKKLSAVKIIAAILLILLGAALIFSAVGLAFFAVSSPGVVSTQTSSLSSQVIPQNTTVFLFSWIVQNGSSVTLDWSASSPISLYVLNSTQYDALLLEHSADGHIPTYIANFTGMPYSYVSHYDLQSGSASLAMLEGRYYFFAGSATNAILDSLTLTQHQHQVAGTPSPTEYLITLVPGIIGVIMITLAVLILRRRVWR